MNALAANECWTVSRRHPRGPLESMQRDAIVQSLPDYHGSKVKTAGSPGVSRATIYRANVRFRLAAGERRRSAAVETARSGMG